MLIIKGTTSSRFSSFLTQVSSKNNLLGRSRKIYLTKKGTSCPIGFDGIITTEELRDGGRSPAITISKSDFDLLKDDDFVVVSPSGHISRIWDYNSTSNSIFVTPSCDCKCVMCPQPPEKHDDETFAMAISLLNRLDPKKVSSICVSGGEPTIMGDKLIDVMSLIKKRFDHAFVMLLSNGKGFSNIELSRKYANVRLNDLITCISFHADIECLHDQIAGVKGSFHKSVQGLYNLAKYRQKIEARVVISKYNASRLPEIAHFIYRNFPFCYHVAFMGMEIIGYARDNYEDLWIDPAEYKKSLYEAVRTLHRADMNVSVYNVPLCLLLPEARSFARQSISDWKNNYTGECIECSKKMECCGFFTTSGDKVSRSIKRII